MSEILTYVKTKLSSHIVIVALAIAGVLLFRSFISEHDARVKAEAEMKADQSAIASLQKQQADVASAATRQVVVLQKEAAAVTTPAEAVSAVVAPAADIADEVKPLDVAALPDAPTKVSVDALPLYQELNVCEQKTVAGAACSQELSLEKQIDAKKDDEISALKAKPSFWHRLGHAAKITGCAAAGGAVGGFVKGGEGAAVGAAGGAAVCQMF